MLIDGNIMSLFLSRNFRNGEHRTYLATISNLFFYILIRWAMFIK